MHASNVYFLFSPATYQQPVALKVTIEKEIHISISGPDQAVVSHSYSIRPGQVFSGGGCRRQEIGISLSTITKWLAAAIK